MEPEELGAGVRVRALADGEVEVWSAVLVPPWTPRRDPLAGSAVRWRDDLYEAVWCTGDGRGWRLRPWPPEEAVRAVFPLDAAWVASLAADEARQRRATVRRLWSLPLAPILALAPARLQLRWHAEWGFPSHRGTLVSAVMELGAGAFLLIHLLAALFGGDGARGGIPPALLLAALPLWTEGLLRLYVVLVRGDPMGSLVGAPLLLVRPATVSRPDIGPKVHTLDPERGRLDLVSPLRRLDWEAGGVLAYRGDPYRLRAGDRLGRDWIYHFQRADESAGPPLRMAPPSAPDPFATAPALPRGRGVLRTTLVTTLVCLGPGDVQTRWAGEMGTRALWFTLAGGLAELVGGVVNLGGEGGSGPLLVLNLGFVMEGLARLVLAAVGGGPVGSVFGFALRPLLERMTGGGGLPP